MMELQIILIWIVIDGCKMIEAGYFDGDNDLTLI